MGSIPVAGTNGPLAQMDEVNYADKMAKFLINEIEPRMKKVNLTFTDLHPYTAAFQTLVFQEIAGQSRSVTRDKLDRIFMALSSNG